MARMDSCPYQTYFSPLAYERWRTLRPCRVVDRSLGYPILLVDEDGAYAAPAAGGGTEDVLATHVCEPGLAALIAAGHVAALERRPGLHGSGVFAAAALAAGEYVGPYRGTVMTDEEWEARHPDTDNFCFSVNDGANAVALDGGSGERNALQYINHSCEPNARMREVFTDGCWHVAVVALRDVRAGEELSHDYKLVTDDADDPELLLPCTCGAARCRGTLFKLTA